MPIIVLHRLVVPQTVRDEFNQKRVAMVRIASAYRGYRGRVWTKQVVETNRARYGPKKLKKVSWCQTDLLEPARYSFMTVYTQTSPIDPCADELRVSEIEVNSLCGRLVASIAAYVTGPFPPLVTCSR